MNELQVIYNQEVLGKEFNIYGTYEEPLFLAKDVAEWIEHSDSTKMIRAVDEDEKGKNIVPTLGGNQEMWFLTEDGLYEVLMLSRKPIAKQFKKEVKQILKTIRKHGVYATDGILEQAIANPDFMIGLLTNLKEEKEKRKQLEEKNKELQPKADKYKQFMDTDGTFGFRELCKHLNGLGYSLKETELRAILKDNNIICKQGRKYVVTQEGVREGYGILKDNLVNNTNRPTTRYTEKLRDYLVKKLA